MKTPQLPENEVERLQDLAAYDVMGSGTEKIFEDITELAAAICGTRFAALTLIDSDRQWIKASHGMEFKHTSRSDSMCGHAILEPDVFEVKNIGMDDRFSDNPNLNGHPRLRFYAGGQLRSSRGNAVGMLCVLDSEPGELDENQRIALRTLSRLVIEILEGRIKVLRTTDHLGALMADLVDEVYIRDIKSMQYVYANGAALKSANCSLDLLRAGKHQHKLEGDESNFPSMLQRLQSGESTVAFTAIRTTTSEKSQQVDINWKVLHTSDSKLVLSVVRARHNA